MYMEYKGKQYKINIYHNRISCYEHQFIKTPEDVKVHSRQIRNGRERFPRGGVTRVVVSCGDAFVGAEAICSIKDNYSRKIGRELAIKKIQEFFEAL